MLTSGFDGSAPCDGLINFTAIVVPVPLQTLGQVKSKVRMVRKVRYVAKRSQ
jgi:hypothetical protein